MLSKITYKEIEEKFGKEIRYPSDCEALSAEISRITKQPVSTSTLKRIFGFVKGTKEPRLFTLDTIAQYIGYANWDVYFENFAKIENSEFTDIEQLDIEGICPDSKVELKYDPERKIILKYKGNFCFEVVEANNSKLLEADIVKIFHLVKEYPLIINQVFRDGVPIGNFKAAKINGLTSIKLINE
jgi:hypothetical protein